MNEDLYPEEKMSGGSRRSVIIGIAVVAVVVVVLAAYFLGRGEGADESGQQVDASTSSEAPRPSQSQEGDVDPLGRVLVIPENPGGDVLPRSGDESSSNLRNPMSKPAGLQWQRAWGVPMAFSSADGPTSLSSDIPRGFTRTPQGAVLAAVQLKARAVYGPMEARQAILSGRVVGGTEAELEEVLFTGNMSNSSIDFGDDEAESPAADVLVPAGFRIRPGNWSDSAATIDIAFGPQTLPDENSDTGTTENPSYAWFPVSVVWRDGDWSLVYSDQLTSTPLDRGTVMASLDSGEWATWT
ncbi:hypothetical protein [Gordonia sp. (in: high G+C Gram-positive bacteria)]|uniref:hypothetical protein n=1 Tax=Gordonia sp. (in: high G+C Gram-positive bacteria) TaxID=84139 RepID=UPI003C7412C0